MKEKESERFEKNIVSLTRIYLRIRIESNITLYDIKLDYIVYITARFVRLWINNFCKGLIAVTSITCITIGCQMQVSLM